MGKGSWGGKQTHVQKTNNARRLPVWEGGQLGEDRDGGDKAVGACLGGIQLGKETGVSTAASPTPSRSPALALAPGSPVSVSSYLSVQLTPWEKR